MTENINNNEQKLGVTGVSQERAGAVVYEQPQQPIQSTKPYTNTEDLSNPEIIFSAILQKEGLTTARKVDLISAFSGIGDVFNNEYFVFYTIAKDMPKIEPNVAFLELYLKTNRASFMRSPQINLQLFQVSDTDAYVEFVNATIEAYKQLSKNNIADSDFYRAVEMHKMEFVNKSSIEILEESTYILSEGIQQGKRTLSGYDDMRSNLSYKFSKIDTMLSKDDRRGAIVYGMNEEDDEEDNKLELVTPFGIEELDKHLGGIYEGDMVSLLAPAKGGKSRFATFVLHNAIINGKSIVMWSVENGYKGWEALIRARHFEYYYNRNQTDPSKKIVLDADMIRKDELPDELRSMERVSWADLRTNKAYGRMVSLDYDFKYDSILKHVEQAIDMVGAKLICVDYLQLVSSSDSNTSKNERIADLYKDFLQFVKRKHVGGLFPSQFKQSVVGDISRKDSADLANIELRDAAGESYEVIKTPDINLALYGNIEDIKNGHMKILSIPSRNSRPFDPIDLFCDLGTCTFASVPKEIA